MKRRPSRLDFYRLGDIGGAAVPTRTLGELGIHLHTHAHTHI